MNIPVLTNCLAEWVTFPRLWPAVRRSVWMRASCPCRPAVRGRSAVRRRTILASSETSSPVWRTTVSSGTCSVRGPGLGRRQSSIPIKCQSCPRTQRPPSPLMWTPGFCPPSSARLAWTPCWRRRCARRGWTTTTPGRPRLKTRSGGSYSFFSSFKGSNCAKVPPF